MNKGFLVTFEGGEGCGKSTQVKKFVEFLENKKIDYVYSREPGGTELGEKIRDILLECKNQMSSKTELFLMNACRAQLVESVVQTALEQNKVMVLDRFFDSSTAYQGYAGGLDVPTIEKINMFATNNIVPDLTFFFDLDYDSGIGRKMLDEKLKNLDRFELKGKQYHQKVREGYLEIARKEKERFVVIDASKSIDEIFTQVTDIFMEKLKHKWGGELFQKLN